MPRRRRGSTLLGAGLPAGPARKRLRRRLHRRRRARSPPPHPRHAIRSLPRAQPYAQEAWGYSRTMRGSPERTVLPASTRTSETTPALFARISLSTFIASRTHTASTRTFTIVPCSGATTVPSEPAAPHFLFLPRLTGALAYPLPASPAPASSPYTLTRKSLPLTSTSTSLVSSESTPPTSSPAGCASIPSSPSLLATNPVV